MRKTTLLFLCIWLFTGASNVLTGQDTPAYELIVFMAPKCPICQDYSVVLNDLAGAFAGKVHFVAYFPNEHTSPEEVSDFSNQYQLTFEAQHGGLNLARQLGAEVTPEVFLINNDGEVLYSGRIDNRFFALGKRRTKVTRHDLHTALTQCIHGQTPEPESTQAVGCIIEYP